MQSMGKKNSLNFRAGEWAEVRSQDEILRTLDRRGCLDNLPFMPEMLQHCGKRFLVYKRADKTCDTITGKSYSRRMKNTVHLSNLRCEGDAHGGCDSTCLLFWKEAWLKRAEENRISEPHSGKENTGSDRCTVEDLAAATRGTTAEPEGGEEVYSCQATELLRASSPLAWWDIRQYWRELASNNVDLMQAVRILSIGLFNWVVGKRGFGRILFIITGFKRYPFVDTRLMIKTNTPDLKLDLQPGETVQVKNIEEIMVTLNKWKNKGLFYDQHGEMLEYCGKKLKVLKRVRKVMDEKSGRLLLLKNESVILEGAICCGHFSPNRLLCPRSIYPFWREIWLNRVNQ